MGFAVSAFAQATEPNATEKGAIAASRDGPRSLNSLLSHAHALPPDVEIRRHVVGTDGTAGVGSTSAGETVLIYSNTLGRDVFGPNEAAWPFADDIATIGVPGCHLDRYEFLVTGDRDGDGSGVGPFSVDFALYEGCPGAGCEVIVGTEGHADLPDAGYHLVVFQVPAEVEVPLPSRFWLQVSFSRTYTGIVMGAPAQVGYSMDRFDFPGFACAATIGGFPEVPHASFYAQVYVRGACPESFVGYQNTNHAGNAYSAGSRAYFADDIRLATRGCNMMAYEVAHRGTGFFRTQLHTFLSDSDPGSGGYIYGTKTDCFSSGTDVQICRAAFDPPIPLPTLTPLVVFRTSSISIGPILTCRQASPGQTENLYMVHRSGAWEVAEFGGQCWAGFDLTIFCEGQPPTGACCDMYLTDEEGESVCRDVLPQMNCATPELWVEGGSCLSDCVGGKHDGEPCTRQADCPGSECPGPFAHPCGVSACCKPDDTCENLTENECYAVPPVESPRLYELVEFCGEDEQWCPFNACLSREGDCSIARLDIGCWDPFCCTDVCGFDPWCCQVAWDEVCLRWFEELCLTPPGNDGCGSPLEVDANSSTVMSTAYATWDADEDGLCCHNEDPGADGLGSVWFKFEATHTSARIHTCNTPQPSRRDSLVSVYHPIDSTTPETACSTLDGIACSDDAPGCGDGFLSDVCVTDLVPGETYFVRLANKTEWDPGIYHLDIESPCTPTVEPVPNDYCHLADTITKSVTPFDITGATFDCPGPPPECLTTMLNDLWYDWTAPCTGQVTIETCGESDADTPDTSLVVYDGCDCLAGDDMVELGCSDFSPSPCLLGSRVIIDVEKGHCYKLRLGGRLGGEPAGNLTIITDCPTFCPAGAVTFIDPPDGAVDARQPHPAGEPTDLQGIDSIIVAAPEGAEAGCFALCETNQNPALHPPYPPELETNQIKGVAYNGDGTYTLTLKRPIAPGEVTTITYTDNDGAPMTGRFIAHPANVNADTTAGPVDILGLIDVLNGVRVAPWGDFSTDVDHDEVVAPSDILRVIDLLSAGWCGTTLPTNPGTCP